MQLIFEQSFLCRTLDEKGDFLSTPHEAHTGKQRNGCDDY